MASISTAIESCRQTVIESDENSEERKQLVQRLINLRICYQDLKERLDRPDQSCLETRGHVFVHFQVKFTGIKLVQHLKRFFKCLKEALIPGVTNSRRVYCQQCCGRVWLSLQSSQHCGECGYSVHSNCMDNIMRECVAVKVKTKPDFIMQICPERSLQVLKVINIYLVNLSTHAWN